MERKMEGRFVTFRFSCNRSILTEKQVRADRDNKLNCQDRYMSVHFNLFALFTIRTNIFIRTPIYHEELFRSDIRVFAINMLQTWSSSTIKEVFLLREVYKLLQTAPLSYLQASYQVPGKVLHQSLLTSQHSITCNQEAGQFFQQYIYQV